MMPMPDLVASLSSITIRLAAFFFLRWLPGPWFPAIIYTAFALYIPSFIFSFRSQLQYRPVAGEIDIVVTDVEFEDDGLQNGQSTGKETQDVIFEETIVLQEVSPKILRTILIGLPSPSTAFWSLLTLLLNFGLVLAVTDFVYRGKYSYPSDNLSFARIGYVSDNEAKLFIREPDQSKMPIYVSIRKVDLSEPSDFLNGWRSVGGVNHVTNATDYSAVLSIPLRGYLETRYLWSTSNGHNGTFTSPPRPGTMPSKNGGKFTFLTSSCILPHFPYNPMNHPLSILGFRNLAKLLPSFGAQFMLFLGDFIYADVPRRFGSDVESFRREYRQIYASPDWPSVGQNLSWIHVLDDHEIANDYSDGDETDIYKNATDPWHHYQTAANPPLARKAGMHNEVRNGVTYFEFTQGPASFFLMDTRRYRDRNKGLAPNSTEKSMLGEQQLADLLSFLERPVPKGVRWKIIASSVPFTKNWGGPSSLDTWAGYLQERQKILEAMWDATLGTGVGVVILSGDRHEFAATAFPPPAGGKWPVSATVNEFSTSPLSQFYLPYRTYRQSDDQDVLIKYIPDGNSKFGAVTIESPQTGDQSLLKFQLFVDGVEAWTVVLVSPPAVKETWWSMATLWG